MLSQGPRRPFPFAFRASQLSAVGVNRDGPPRKPPARTSSWKCFESFPRECHKITFRPELLLSILMLLPEIVLWYLR